MILKALKDITNHTNGLVDSLKITGDDKKTKFEGFEEESTSVIIKGELNKPIKEFKGQFGIGDINVLKGYVDLPVFYADNAKINVKSEKKNEEECPTELEFVDEKGQTAVYRLAELKYLRKQPEFKGTTWDVEFQPEKSKITDFQQFASVLSRHEKLFSPKTKNNNVYFQIGQENSSQHRSSVIFAENVKGELKNEQYWPIHQVLNILKLESPDKLTVKFADAGAMQIDLHNDVAKYQFILPPRRKN